jgi:hypothetical protein
MSERGTALMTKAGRQLDEIAAFLGTLNQADLAKPCADGSAGDTVDAAAAHRAGDTVGATASHMADGYDHLGRLLPTTGYVPGSQPGGDHHSHDHSHDHDHARVPEALPDLRARLMGGKARIALLADLTDEQLDSVPPAVGLFADGRRTLEQVIEAVIAHQAAHFATLKRAVA